MPMPPNDAETQAALAQPQRLSPEDAARIGEMQKRLAATFGEIVAVLMRSPQHKHLYLTDLEWLILPSVATGQFALAEARHKDTGVASPVAVLLWASVSDEVDARLSSNMGTPVKLKPAEVASGPNAWLVEAVGDPRAVKPLVDQALAGPLKGRGLKVVTRGADGRPALQVLRASDPGTAAAPIS